MSKITEVEYLDFPSSHLEPKKFPWFPWVIVGASVATLIHYVILPNFL